MKNWLSAKLNPSQVDQWKMRLVSWMEERSPKISRTILSYASQILDPQSWGLGLSLSEVSDQGILGLMTQSFLPTSPDRVISPGRLVSAAEFIVRLYWERRLYVHTGRRSLVSARYQEFHQPEGELTLRMDVSDSAREEVDMKLSALGTAEALSEVSFFDCRGLLVAQVEFKVQLTAQKSLPG